MFLIGLTVSNSLERTKTIITQDKYDEFIGLGHDCLLGTLSLTEIFDRFVAPFYATLGLKGQLDNEALKNYARYQIGLN